MQVKNFMYLPTRIKAHFNIEWTLNIYERIKWTLKLYEREWTQYLYERMDTKLV